VIRERALDVLGETGVARSQVLEPRGALGGLELERPVELGSDGEPALRAQTSHA
jgi:hypothetical protein